MQSDSERTHKAGFCPRNDDKADYKITDLTTASPLPSFKRDTKRVASHDETLLERDLSEATHWAEASLKEIK